MNQTTKIILGIIVLALVVWGVYAYSQPEPAQGDVFKLGLAVSQTGYAANWGEGEIRAVELVLDEYRDELNFPVELVIEDTEAEGLATVNAMKKLIEVERVDAIIGPTWGDSFQGGYPIAEQAQIPVISSSAAFESLGEVNPYSFAFSTWWPQEQEARVLVEHMKESGVQNVQAIHDQDAFNAKFTDIFISVAQQNGITVQRTSVPVGTNDFRTVIAKVDPNSTQAILALFQDTGSVGPMMKQFREQDVPLAVYSTTSAQNEENLENFPGLFDGLFYSFPDYVGDKEYQKVQDRFTDRYGADAAEGPAFVNAYNAAKMLFEALKDGRATGTELRERLANVRTEGIGTDDLYFNENRQIGNVAFKIKTIQNNQFVDVE